MTLKPDTQRDFPFSSDWKWKHLIAFNIAALLLLASWMLPPLQTFWRSLDESMFFILNGSLSEGAAWQYFWALSNVRLADLVPLSFILLSLTFPFAGIPAHKLQRALLGFVVLIILMFLFRKSIHVITVDLGLSGDSPTLLLEPAYRLSQLVPGVDAKDFANRSFPGDHAAVVWCWAGYLIMTARTRIALFSLVLALLFTLPRMVGGAHWFSDNYVGGVAVALLTLGWAFYSPILNRPVTWLESACTPIFRIMLRVLPPLKLLPFFQR